MPLPVQPWQMASAPRLGNFNDTLCDDRAGKGRAEQVLVLVDRTCLYGGINIFLNEFFLEVFNVELRCTGLQCFFFQTVKLRALTHVGGNRDDLAVVVVFLQPRMMMEVSRPPEYARTTFLISFFAFAMM